jgi:hypothetical protein
MRQPRAWYRDCGRSAAGDIDTVAESLRADRETEAPLVYVEPDAATQIDRLAESHTHADLPIRLRPLQAPAWVSENNDCKQCCMSSPLVTPYGRPRCRSLMEVTLRADL